MEIPLALFLTLLAACDSGPTPEEQEQIRVLEADARRVLSAEFPRSFAEDWRAVQAVRDEAGALQYVEIRIKKLPEKVQARVAADVKEARLRRAPLWKAALDPHVAAVAPPSKEPEAWLRESPDYPRFLEELGKKLATLQKVSEIDERISAAQRWFDQAQAVLKEFQASVARQIDSKPDLLTSALDPAPEEAAGIIVIWDWERRQLHDSHESLPLERRSMSASAPFVLAAVESKSEMIGTYRNTDAFAFRIDYTVRVFQMPEGKPLGTLRFQGQDPPPTIERSRDDSTPVYGPTPNLAELLPRHLK